jgi:hypothetical protein
MQIVKTIHTEFRQADRVTTALFGSLAPAASFLR